MHLKDVLIEEGANLLAPNVAEKAFDAKCLLALNNCHVVQLKEFNDEFHPLEVLCFELSLLASPMADLLAS